MEEFDKWLLYSTSSQESDSCTGVTFGGALYVWGLALVERDPDPWSIFHSIPLQNHFGTIRDQRDDWSVIRYQVRAVTTWLRVSRSWTRPTQPDRIAPSWYVDTCPQVETRLKLSGRLCLPQNTPIRMCSELAWSSRNWSGQTWRYTELSFIEFIPELCRSKIKGHDASIQISVRKLFHRSDWNDRIQTRFALSPSIDSCLTHSLKSQGEGVEIISSLIWKIYVCKWASMILGQIRWLLSR